MWSDYISGLKCGICRRVLCNRITAPWCRGSRLSARFPLFQTTLNFLCYANQFAVYICVCDLLRFSLQLSVPLCHIVSVPLFQCYVLFSVSQTLCGFFAPLYFIFAFAGLVWTGSLNFGPKFCLLLALKSWVDALGSLKTDLWNGILLSPMLQVVL